MKKKDNQIISFDNNNLPQLNKKYQGMLKNINKSMPLAKESENNFYKSHSQYMYAMLDLTTITPMRSIKQILAEVNKTRRAIENSIISRKESQIKIKEKEKKLKNKDLSEEEIELLKIEIFKTKHDLSIGEGYLKGAIRKLNFFLNQYKNILKKLNKKQITEEDFENEEIKHHIFTCLKQALNAARARGGIIDEGNMIYLFDMGINGRAAQEKIFELLRKENEIIENKKFPSHGIVLEWLEECYELFKNESIKFATKKGIELLDDSSLNKINDNLKNL